MDSKRFKKLFLRWLGVALGCAIVLLLTRMIYGAPRLEETLHVFGYNIPFNVSEVQFPFVEALAIIFAFLEVSFFIWTTYVQTNSDDKTSGSGGGIIALIVASTIIFGYQAFFTKDIGLGLLVFVISGFIMMAASTALLGFSDDYRGVEVTRSRFVDSLITCSIFGYGLANVIAFGLAVGVLSILAGSVCFIIGIILGLIAEYIRDRWYDLSIAVRNATHRRITSAFKWLIAK